MSEEEERENGNHIPVGLILTFKVTESRFDRDSAGSEVEEEEVGEGSPQSNAMTEGDYIPDSPASSPIELKQELPKYLPALQGCRSVEEFQCLNRIEEGTYGVVYRAKDKKTDEIVALKRLKMEKEKEGFPITSLREINTILKAQHLNIVTVREIVVGSNMDKIYIVMNYVEHDLKSLMETMKQPFLPGEVKTLMIQLLRGVKHLHDNWILHRDLKTSNLLLSHSGILKVGDFGLAREYGSPLKPYTPVVVTLWYRAPELLLGAKEYSTAIDMWSVGCIFGELLTQKPLFPGKSEIDQINKVFKDLGTPSEKIWPGYNELPAVKKMTFTEYPYNNLRKRFGALLSDQGFDLMNNFLTYYPARRITAEDGLKHEYFRETPLPIDPSMFPTWPAKSEQQRVKRGTSPRPPEGGLGYSQLGDDDLKDTGFHLTTTNQGASAAGPGFSLKF
ncbi:cyclin-dependent kinase 11B isoform X11 [Cyrtonyx montezumae]